MRIALWQLGPFSNGYAVAKAIEPELRRRGHKVDLIPGDFDEDDRRPELERIAGSGADIVHAIDYAWNAGTQPKPDVLQLTVGTEFQSVQVRLRRAGSPLHRAWEKLRGTFDLSSLKWLGWERTVASSRPLPAIVVPSHYVAQQWQQFLGLQEHELVVVPPAPLMPADLGEGDGIRSGPLDRDVVAALPIRGPQAPHESAETVAAALKRAQAELAGWPKRVALKLMEVNAVNGGVFAGASFCVDPSWDSADGFEVLPYLAKQIPVITTKYNGAAELIDDGVNGFVIDSPDDAESLADRMLRLCDSVTRFRFRSNLREVSQYLRIERYVDDLLALYEDILRRKRGGGDSGGPSAAGGTGFAV